MLAKFGKTLGLGTWESKLYLGKVYTEDQLAKLNRLKADFDWTGVGFPVSFRDINGFESRNQILINILAVEDRQIYICRKGGNYEHMINLMLITESNSKHYVAIKSLSRLLSSQNTKHKENNTFV